MIPRISPRRVVIPRRLVIKIVKTITRVLTKPKRSGHEGEKKEKKGRTGTLSALRGSRKKKGDTKGDVLRRLCVDDG